MAENGNIEHEGRVQRVEGRSVFVAIVANSACAGCRARKACGVSESEEKIVEVVTADAAEYAAGEQVVVSVQRQAGLRAVWFAYTVPLIVLIALLAGAKALGAGDGAAAGASIGGVAVYYLLLWALKDRIAQKVRFGVRKAAQ